MIHDLVVFHASSTPQATSAASSNDFVGELKSPFWMEWSTCVRQLKVGFRDWLEDGDVRGIRGRPAYEFLLEVICGLHSPMLGETEVFGQFRERILKNDVHPRVAKLGSSLISDAKKVREGFLTNLGANSYGSLTRKYTKGHSDVIILGAGKLALEILPWLKDKKSVKVAARSARDFQAFNNVEVVSMEEFPKATAAVVAAPIETVDLKKWLERFESPLNLVIDLRETSLKQEILGVPSVVLQDFFSELNVNQAQIRERIGHAKAAIARISSERLKSQELRPFGWDDICA